MLLKLIVKHLEKSIGLAASDSATSARQSPVSVHLATISEPIAAVLTVCMREASYSYNTLHFPLSFLLSRTVHLCHNPTILPYY